MQKNVLQIFILIVMVMLVISIIICGLIFVLKKEPYEILTKKFYIPIKEQYEIAFFENINGDFSIRHCYAELKVNENEYNAIKHEMNKSGYSICSLDEFTIYLENSNYWLPGEKIVEAYQNFTVENRLLVYTDRIQMDIFITEAENGYRRVYMSRN